MCWSRNVSIITFVLAIIGVVYLWHRNKPNDRWIALFAGVVAMIQFAEIFMWSDQTCGTVNKYASMFALLILALEPAANMIGGIYFGETPNKQFLKGMLGTYVIFIALIYSGQLRRKPVNWCGVAGCQYSNEMQALLRGRQCNLQWQFMENFNMTTAIIWILFLLVPLLTMTPRFQGILFFALGLGTLAAAWSINNAAVGSMCCWLAIIIIYVKILI